MELFFRVIELIASLATITAFFISARDRLIPAKLDQIANQPRNTPTRRGVQLRMVIGLSAILSSLFMLAFLQFSGRNIPLTTEDAATIAGSMQLFALGVLLLRK